ncbi:MAG: amino acid permease [Bdellovibrionales bacterium]|nr:amino acid permease [Bdellovibrionales bacterium]
MKHPPNREFRGFYIIEPRNQNVKFVLILILNHWSDKHFSDTSIATRMNQAANQKKFGTIQGVFIPSILTIFGVIMYLRMGWMVSQVNLIGSIVIITLSSLITFLTGLSIAATATNMKVGAGGAYYMISRSFGIETGAAIGIPLFFAQSLGIAFYITGFSESLAHYIPFATPTLIGAIALTALFILTYYSTDLTLKIQFFIFGLIVLSLVSFFLGSSEHLSAPQDIVISKTGFWTVFAVIFPAVTGIEAGLAMSGDLKNPARSLPIGTIAAVITGYIVYLIIPIYLYYRISQEHLASNYFIMKDYAAVGSLVVLGLWGSTLSSAVGALLGGPRTLQALAKDRVLFSYFSSVTGPNASPRRATVASYFVALFTILIGDLNTIASILSMFFLTSYGLINLASFSENFMKNPSWRPNFKIHWIFSLIGSLFCFIVMLLIDAASALVAFGFVILIYIWTKKRNLGKHWSDIRRGMLVNMARDIIYRLSERETDARSWRPNIVVFSGSPNQRFPLIHFGESLSSGLSFLTVCSILSKEHRDFERKKSIQDSIKQFIKKKNIHALTEVHFANTPYEGAVAFAENYGLGGLKPNLLIFGQSANEENHPQFAGMLKELHSYKRNVIILRNHNRGEDETLPVHSNEIHVWWGRQTQNANLMLALAFLLSQNPERRKSSIFLKSVISDHEEKEKALKEMSILLDNARIPIRTEVIQLNQGQTFFSTAQRESQQADLMFMGIRAPREDESVESYAQYYGKLLELTSHFPPTAMVMASEEIPFKEIFESH